MAADDINRTRSGNANGGSLQNISSNVGVVQPAMSENKYREGFIIYNNSDKPLYVGYNDQLSLSNFVFIVPPQGFYESGYVTYTGDIFALYNEQTALAEGPSNGAMVWELGK